MDLTYLLAMRLSCLLILLPITVWGQTALELDEQRELVERLRGPDYRSYDDGALVADRFAIWSRRGNRAALLGPTYSSLWFTCKFIPDGFQPEKEGIFGSFGDLSG